MTILSWIKWDKTQIMRKLKMWITQVETKIKLWKNLSCEKNESVTSFCFGKKNLTFWLLDYIHSVQSFDFCAVLCADIGSSMNYGYSDYQTKTEFHTKQECLRTITKRRKKEMGPKDKN